MNDGAEIKSHLRKNVVLLICSVAVAIVLAKTGIFEMIISAAPSLKVPGMFLAGFFFTSVITVGPAAVVIAEIAQSNSIWLLALVGAAGSVIGDLIIFKFVRSRITDDFAALFQRPKIQRLTHLLHLEILRFLMPFLGALIIASPLPDEIGLAMMGLSKIKTIYFIPLSYFMNLGGILVVSLSAQWLS